MGVFFSIRHFGSALNHTNKVIVCDETVNLHQHTDDCYGYDEDGNEILICGYADYLVHTHNQYCFNDDGTFKDFVVDGADGFDMYFTNDCSAATINCIQTISPTLQSTGDPITDLSEDLAAEQKARTTYDNILRLTDDPDVKDPIRFLREREVVHYQRFGEALAIAAEKLDQRNVYYMNPAFGG